MSRVHTKRPPATPNGPLVCPECEGRGWSPVLTLGGSLESIPCGNCRGAGQFRVDSGREFSALKTDVAKRDRKKAKPPRQLSSEGFFAPSASGGLLRGVTQSAPSSPVGPAKNASVAKVGALRGEKGKRGRGALPPPEGGVSRETSGPVFGYVCPECGVVSDLWSPDLSGPAEPRDDLGPWRRVSTSLYGFRYRCNRCHPNPSEPSFVGPEV